MVCVGCKSGFLKTDRVVCESELYFVHVVVVVVVVRRVAPGPGRTRRFCSRRRGDNTEIDIRYLSLWAITFNHRLLVMI
jgi:hypothetical protein